MSEAPTLTGPLHRGWLVALGVTSGLVTQCTRPDLWRELGMSARSAPGLSTLSGLLGVLLLWPLARRGAGLRAPVALAWALVPQLALSLLSAWIETTWPLVQSCGEAYGHVAEEFMAYLLGLVVSAGVTAFLGGALGVSRLGAGPARRGAGATLAALTLVAACAAVRAHRLPSFEGYVRSLPEVAAIPAIEARNDGALQVSVYAAGPVHLRRACRGDSCMAALDARGFDDLVDWGASPHVTYRVSPSALRVFYDAHLGVVAFEGAQWSFAFERSTRALVNVGPGQVARRRSAPRAWLVSALVGLALAAALFAWPRRAPASLRAWRTAREGTLRADGAVTFPDGTATARVASDSSVEAGPVLAQVGAPAAPFRDDARPSIVAYARGTHDDLRRALAAVEGAPRVLAAVIALVASAPLLVAAAAGLVF